MRNTNRCLSAGLFACLATAFTWAGSGLLGAQAPQTPPPTQAPGTQGPTFRVSVDLITTDLIVRDSRGQFVADLKPGEIEIYEDGVKQAIASVELIHGGRAYGVLAPPPAPVQEGIILPRNRPTNDTAGRVFLLFIDDLHLGFRDTPRTRELLKKMLKNLIHEGDMFGIVTTGTSVISQQLTYDRQVLDSAISRITGNSLKPSEIIQGGQGANGPTELRHRAHVAFSTAYDLMKNLEKLQNRRKAVVYISNGYDFNPFEQGRIDEQARRMNIENSSDLQNDPFFRNQQSQQMLAETDLVRELAELTRAANRANATLYTIDPRGLIAGQDLDEEVPTKDWNEFVRESQNSLRVLAEQTGGFAVVNMNDFDKGLKRIDAETSDYYVLGYYSSNPDPMKRTRKLDVKIPSRTGLSTVFRTSYSLRPNTPPAAVPAP
jgi:VWFA-related protein